MSWISIYSVSPRQCHPPLASYGKSIRSTESVQGVECSAMRHRVFGGRFRCGDDLGKGKETRVDRSELADRRCGLFLLDKLMKRGKTGF